MAGNATPLNLEAAKRLTEIIEEKGLRNIDLARKIQGYGKEVKTGCPELDSQAQMINRLRKGTIPMTQYQAVKICDAINQFSTQGPRHAPSDITPKWLMGISDQKTYEDEMTAFFEEVNENDIIAKKKRDAYAPENMFNRALHKKGYGLISFNLPEGRKTFISERTDDGWITGETKICFTDEIMANVTAALDAFAALLVQNILDEYIKTLPGGTSSI